MHDSNDILKYLRNKPRQERSEITVMKIIQAANDLFGENGVDNSTMTNIAKRAGISIGALYRFFPDKEAIINVLAEIYLGQLSEIYLSILSAPGNINDIEHLVPKLVKMTFKAVDANKGYYAATVFSYPIKAESVANAVRDAQVKFFMDWFKQSDVDLPEKELKQISRFIIETVRLLYATAPSSTKQKKQHLNEISTMIIAYLKVRLFK